LASFSPERQEGFWAFDELATAFERLSRYPVRCLTRCLKHPTVFEIARMA
jgi:hypothetical protein